MDQFGIILAAFLTGLTTGGLSCLAVQGGLLASSLAGQIEKELTPDLSPGPFPKGKGRSPAAGRDSRGRRAARAANQAALPITAFLLAKLVAYTLLGGLFGWAGSFLTLSPTSRAVLLLAIGVFMLGNGLRMLNVHPIFRYFNLEPPKFITRYIRRTAKAAGEASPAGLSGYAQRLAAPLFLGALTVLIPCGVTQAMLAAALGTGSAALGAAMLFAFTLGTSPVFFLVAYLTTQLGARLEKYFLRFVAVVVLTLGLVSLDGGLNLLGSPFSISRLAQSLFPPAQAPSGPPPASVPDISPVAREGAGLGRIELSVRNNGFFPKTLKALANTPLTLDLVTENTHSCARDFVIPALQYYSLLPPTGRTPVEIPAQAPGAVLPFTCSMGMYTGQIVFE